jgi:hypothetical protein
MKNDFFQIPEVQNKKNLKYHYEQQVYKIQQNIKK